MAVNEAARGTGAGLRASSRTPDGWVVERSYSGRRLRLRVVPPVEGWPALESEGDLPWLRGETWS